jgi:WD40 repeat protein
MEIFEEPVELKTFKESTASIKFTDGYVYSAFVESAAEKLGLSKMPDKELCSLIHSIDSSVSVLDQYDFLRFLDSSSTIIVSGGAFPRKICICSQDEQTINYCVSPFDEECSHDTSYPFGKAWSPLARAVCVAPDGRTFATILSTKKDSGSCIALFALPQAASASVSSMKKLCIGDFEISANPESVDCCFLTPQRIVIRAAQRLFEFFISQKKNNQQKLKPVHILPSKTPAFFSSSRPMIFACGENKLLVSVRSGEKSSKMLLLRCAFPAGWSEIELLDEEDPSMLRAAHQSGFYLRAFKGEFEQKKPSPNPIYDQSCVVYDLTQNPAKKHTIIVGAVSAVAFSPSGESFCCGVITNKEPQICIYACGASKKPQLLATCAVSTASLINQLIWPEWGGGIIALSESLNAHGVDFQSGLRRVVAAWRALARVKKSEL